MNINKPLWKIIKQICLVDEARARNLLKSNNLKVVRGCINLLQDYEGNLYRIPNFCINQPFFEKEIGKVNDLGEITPKTLHLFLYDLYGNKKYEINIDNKKMGIDIKSMFCQIAQISEEDFKLKFIFGGTEIQNEHYLCQYKLDNEYTIQVYKLKREIN